MLLPNVLALLVKAVWCPTELGEFGFAPFLMAGTACAIAVPPLWWVARI